MYRSLVPSLTVHVMDQPTQDALRKWKQHTYRPTDIPFADAVYSLSGREPLIEARQSLTRKSEWIVSFLLVPYVEDYHSQS